MLGRIGVLSGLLTIAVAGSLSAGDIYQWTDEEGHPHYSNRGGNGGGDSSGGGGGTEEGWESALERKQGGEDLQEKAEAAINGLELQMTRRKREREHAQEELEATQASIIRAQGSSPAEIPALRVRETTQLTELRKMDLELASIELRIARLRALKAASQEQKPAR
jgi:hypothetical protein